MLVVLKKKVLVVLKKAVLVVLKKAREMGENVTSFWGIAFVASVMGWP